MFEYMTVQEAPAKWGITERRVQILCAEYRIPGSLKKSGAWFIPQSVQKPFDERKRRKNESTGNGIGER